MSSRRAKQQKKNAEKRRLQHQQVRDAKERLEKSQNQAQQGMFRSAPWCRQSGSRLTLCRSDQWRAERLE